MAESRGHMQELILLGRNSGAHSKDLAKAGEIQTRWSVVGGRRDGRMLRGRSSGNSLLVATAILGLNSSISKGWM